MSRNSLVFADTHLSTRPINLIVRTKKTPVTYRPTHDRTIPPPDQVITSDAKNILLRHFYQRAEEKLRPKRAASENLSPEHANKHPRASSSDSSL
ncbi:uncharacterized protein LOC111407594 isoform X2 [Olea europaea var. sylvestris]|uniref:uncharacterized protein LOC111407594 isoform X2 n=1 Tax=Olea europaea var. sylvestris TaxID=158386 RepID=UPI000C1D05BD|nr:uncharacterized protein LOC111407594 isoform X2 [Olea europaea var. sylvestris]